MGAGTYVACIPCRKVYYCGYGGYRTSDERKQRYPASQHEGHERLDFTEDYTFEEDGHLWVVGFLSDNKMFIENYSDFEHIDLTNETVTKQE